VREVGGLKGAAEDGDRVVLGGDIVEGLWAAGGGISIGIIWYVWCDNRTISQPMAATCFFLVVRVFWKNLQRLRLPFGAL
jgi:hypothetical protein